MDEENLDVVEETADKVESVEDTQNEEGLDIVEEASSKDNDNLDMDKLIEERANALTEERIQKRLARERNKFDKEISKYKELGRIVESGLGVDSIDDAITQTRNFYTDQGIDIPEINPEKEWEDAVIGEAYAKKIAEYGYEEMEEEANRIASIPLERRTTREKAIFNELCKNLISLKDEESLRDIGVDTSILKDEEFNKFRNQFNSNVKVADIYSMYNKMTGNFKTIPATPGSAKTVKPVNQVADYISPEDFDKLTDEQLSDPRIMAIVDKSRANWYKE